ncbi:gp188 [Sphingomonas phage PAU]|uniref:gp188 n=1 Tax=Sphingomonas phage PAU TaxID=1150991 RepID=UPI000257335A|nr:gp188 [Sphingomonas phage PAU]AFF28186.1 gp188 [Sphingomonas phage PAU]
MKHRSKILTWAYWLASREAAAVFVLMGIISQFSHVYFITYEISSLVGFWKIAQAIIMSLFFSCGLAYFILRGVNEDDDSKENKRSKNLILLFTWIEALINFAYWGGHLIYDPLMNNEQVNWFQFGISIPFAVLIPVLLKAYGFSILVNEPSMIEEIEEETSDISETMYNELLDKLKESEEKYKNLQGAYKMKFTGETGGNKVIDVELQPKDLSVIEETKSEESIIEEPITNEIEETVKVEEPKRLSVTEEIDLEMQKINEQQST